MSKSVIWRLLFMVFFFGERKIKSRLITYNMYYKKYVVVGELLQLNCLTPWSAGKRLNLIF